LTSGAPGPSSHRLSWPTLIRFSLPNLPLAALDVAVFVYLPPYLAGHLGVNLALVGIVWFGVRILDLPVDPLLALAMDRTRMRIGRYRPWLVLGAPILMIAFYMMFMAKVGIGPVYLLVSLLVLYLGTSIFLLSHQAWGATLARQYHERSRLFGVVAIIGVVGTMAILAVPIIGASLGRSDTQNIQSMGWFLIAMTPVVALVTATTTGERINPGLRIHAFAWSDYLGLATKPEVVRLFLAQMALTLGPGWMSAIYLFFFKQSRGFTTQQATLLLAAYVLAGFPGALLTSALARRLGKHRALMATTTGFSLGVLSIVIVPKGDFWASVPSMAWCGAMAAGFGLTIRAMMADVGDEVRLEGGRERISLLYSVLTLASKIAAAFSIGLTLPLLAALGFHATDGTVNTPAAVRNLELAFLVGPILFVMLGGACVIGWKLDARRQGQIRAELDARDAVLTEGQSGLDQTIQF
jgi:GPH family glycoside/pentoside/hexuronide:cation symporter